MAAAGTAIVFFSMAGVWASTQRNLSFIGNILEIGCIVVMLAVVGNIFFANPALHLTICGVVVLVSSMTTVPAEPDRSGWGNELRIRDAYASYQRVQPVRQPASDPHSAYGPARIAN